MSSKSHPNSKQYILISSSLELKWIRCVYIPRFSLFPHLCFPQSSVSNSNSTNGILSKRRKWREDDGWRRKGETHLELRLNGGRRRESTDWKRLESWKWEIGFQFPEKLWCSRHRICFVQRKDERRKDWKTGRCSADCSLCIYLLKFNLQVF